jgi:hypothetical protein
MSLDISPIPEQSMDSRVKWLCEKMPETFGAAYAAVQAVKDAETANREQFKEQLAALERQRAEAA